MGKYNGRLTNTEICKLLKQGIYRVDTETGTVYGKRSPNQPLATWERRNPRLNNDHDEADDYYVFVELYHDGKRRGISVASLVWMSVTGKPIPIGFEIHHRDLNTKNNAWTNLICLHKKDHQKIHGLELIEDDTPF